MSSKIELPSAHKGSLSAVARSIEDSLNDITGRLQLKYSNTNLRKVEPSFSDAERTLILETVEEIRRTLINFIEVFDIQPFSVTESQIIQAQYTHISSLLQDSYSGKMKGYGKIPAKDAILLDKQVALLAAKVENLRKVISPTVRE